MNRFETQADPQPIISLTTDFGRDDGYVGTMEGVILNICPTATITHLSHTIPPQDIQRAAFVLYQSFAYFPPQAIHCVVVDPGVGSKRRAIALRTNHGIFVGPDNGVFNLVLEAQEVELLEAITLLNPAYHLSPVSATFHGRDIFAPAAAHLARGVPLAQLGPAAINLVQLDQDSGKDQSRIIHIDHFGNITLNMTADEIQFPELVTFTIKGRTIQSLSHTFSDVAEGKLLAYIGSTRNHIEIAVRNGHAAQVLDVQVGDLITITHR